MIKTIKYIACCLVGVFSLLPLQAQNIIRPKIAGPNNLWVNSYNGVLFFELTDFETQNSAMPMQLCFYYNSSACSIDYGYGLGFSLGFEMRYREDVIGGVDIESGDGRIDHFAKYGDEYKAPAGVFSKLVRPTFDTYLLTTKDGTKYFFDNAHHHKVTAIEDRNGNITTFKYQDTLLVEIKDAVGHTITLDYTDGLLVKASSTFSSGNFKYEYDGLRRLRKRIDPLGNVTLYGYSRQNRLDEITDANGFKTLIAYNNTGMVSRLKTDVSDKSIRYDGDKTVFIDYTEPNNVYSYYKWDEKGRVIEKVGLCCGIQSKLKYDNDDNVTKLIDADDNISSYTYDEQGNMLSISDPLGYEEHYTYEPVFNLVSTYSDKNGSIYSFNYDTKGNLITLSGPLGVSYNYKYDEHGWITMITDSKGNVTRNTYNSDGTKASVMNADGGTVNYTYDSYGRLIVKTDPMGNSTSFTYDDLGRITKEIDALGNVTTKAYDKVGNIVRVSDAVGNITAFTYDALAHITSKTDAMGGVYSYEYDGRGNIIAVVDPLGTRQEFSYNDRDRIESYINGEGEKTNYDYDVKGNLMAEILPNGNIISYDYDKLDRLVEVSDNMGLIAIYEYDGIGNRISITDGMNHKTSYTYDNLNRKTSRILPSGSKSQYEYDKNGNLLSITNELGNTTYYEYDAMNRLTTHTDAVNAKSQLIYDLNGNIIRLTDAKGNVTTYAYDALNRATSITFPNGCSLQYTYDKIGRIVSFKDRSENEFKYSYDVFGNICTKSYPDGNTDNYIYDALGRMISAKNKEASVTFSYDQTGRILTETLNDKTTRYEYDVANGKRTLIYPSGIKIIEVLNARNLISDVFKNGEEIASMSYNPAGQKTSQSYANGVTTEYAYNENGWLSSISDGSNIIKYVMDYNAYGNIIQRRDLINPDNNETYGYDAINQLISFKRGISVEKSYQFDLLGNRINVLENGELSNYVTDNVNAYTRVTGGQNFTLHYDDNGNLLNDDKHSYKYDYNNKIVYVNETNDSYKYDALGRRIAKNNICYYYLGEQMIEMQADNVTTSYLYGNYIDEALQMVKGENEYYYHLNHLNSCMSLSDRDGNIVEKVVYDPYGCTTIIDNDGNILQESLVGNNILFTGREYENELAVYHSRTRTLSPALGRFMQKDPLVYIDGMNDFSYVKNDVLSRLDPYGLTGIGPIGNCGGDPNYDFCLRYPQSNLCQDKCKQNPNYPWCKKGGGGRRQPEEKPLFGPIQTDGGLSTNNNNGWTNSWADNFGDWLNGPHPYLPVIAIGTAAVAAAFILGPEAALVFVTF